MSFVSFAFAALYAVVLAARVLLGRSKCERGYLGVLLLASLVFYGWHTPSYLLLILVSTGVDFIAGRELQSTSRTPFARKIILAVSVVVNLGMLFGFKYANFFAEIAGAVLAPLGVHVPARVVSAELPIGISFYTFQSMSYTIDVYRGRLAPESSFFRFLLFVSFFPQLVAGPIVRAKDFLRQLPRPRRIRARVFAEGGYLIVRGFFLKMVVADNLSYFVDSLWAEAARPGGSGWLGLWVALLFSGQIFADFAGYSSIARGLGYTLGFRLPVNFRAPYIAATFSEFWRRWHISLSTWLRDYLYVSLGGNRRGRLRTYVNLMLVMLLGGLWHGAAATFVVWGAIHGIALALERWMGLNRPVSARARWLKLPWFLVVQTGVLAAWVFFRAGSATEAVTMLGNILAGGAVPWLAVGESFIFLVPVAILHLRTLAAERYQWRVGALEKSVLAGAMAAAVLVAYGDPRGFIYFQF